VSSRGWWDGCVRVTCFKNVFGVIVIIYLVRCFCLNLRVIACRLADVRRRVCRSSFV